MSKEALVINIDDRTLFTVGATGEKTYAPGFNAERVLEEMSVFALEVLGDVEMKFDHAINDETNVYGIYIYLKRDDG